MITRRTRQDAEHKVMVIMLTAKPRHAILAIPIPARRLAEELLC